MCESYLQQARRNLEILSKHKDFSTRIEMTNHLTHYNIDLTKPPSTLMAAPLVPEAKGLT
jgi:hypothetical protein